MMNLLIHFKGGPGFGHKGHVGRPGKRGGSLPGTGTAASAVGTGVGQATTASGGQKPKELPKEEIASSSGGTTLYDTSDQIKENEFGKGYFITRQGKLVDITSEFGGGTNDHVGFVLAMEDPEVLGLDKSNLKMLDELRRLDDRLYVNPTLAWDDPKYQRMDERYMNLNRRLWSKVYDARNLRVREFGHVVAIDGAFSRNTIAKKLQNMVLDGKLRGGTDTEYIVEPTNEQQHYRYGWGSSYKFSWKQLMEAESVSDLASATLGYKEVMKRCTIVLRGSRV